MAFGGKDKKEVDRSGIPTTIREAIGQRLAEIAPNVEDKILDTFVDREVDKRAKAVVNVIDQLVKLEQDLRKIKPDQQFFDADGKETGASYSKTKVEEKKKLEDRIAKFTNAVNKAVDKGDYGDVYNLASGKSDQSGSSSDSD